MPESTKKRYFKKEKKSLRLKRHKAPPNSQKKSTKRPRGEKDKEIKAKKLQFPKISRVITEVRDIRKIRSYFGKKFTSKLLISRNFILSICVCIVCIFSIIFAWQLYDAGKMWQATLEDRSHLTEDLQTWENITQKYPTYRDAYFEAAVIAYRLGDTKKEMELLQKLKEIDPNFNLAGELEKISR